MDPRLVFQIALQLARGLTVRTEQDSSGVRCDVFGGATFVTGTAGTFADAAWDAFRRLWELS